MQKPNVLKKITDFLKRMNSLLNITILNKMRKTTNLLIETIFMNI